MAALASARRSWTIAELAAAEQVPPKILEQVLLALRRAGHLASTRGAKGGYRLRSEPSGVRVREIIEIFDGPFALVPCTESRPKESCTCPDPGSCPVRLAMAAARKEIEAALDGQTLEDLVLLGDTAGPPAFDI